MALTDVLFMSANAGKADRGNVGSLSDAILASMTNRLFMTVPTAAQVEAGVTFGQQGTELTGSFVGGGGGSGGMSRGRVANA